MIPDDWRDIEEIGILGILNGTSEWHPHGLRSSTLFLFWNRHLWTTESSWYQSLDGETRYRCFGNALQRLRRRNAISYDRQHQMWRSNANQEEESS